MRWFHKQSEAIKFCEEHGGDERGVFVLQKFDGTRKFCVQSYQEFAKLYLSYHLDLCHYYEVIRDNTPCKLYFDIDISLNEGSMLDGAFRVAVFKSYVNHCLNVEYCKNINVNQILHLDSKSTVKFSQHLIFPDVIFKSNQECGNFVKKLADAAKDALYENKTCALTKDFPIPKLHHLFVEAPSSSIQFIADLTVYSRNRHFRIYRSSKLNKAEHLLVANENTYPYLNDEQLLIDSFIISLAGTSAEHQLVCEPPKKRVCQRVVSTREARPAASDHPYLDEFVRSELQKAEHYTECVVDSVLYSRNGNCVAYTIRGSLWCENVHREHTTNRPYFCANIKTGRFYQMCNSQGCRGFRSTGVQIPLDIRVKYELGDENELLQMLLATDEVMEKLVSNLT